MKFVLAGQYKDYWHQSALERALECWGHDVFPFGYGVYLNGTPGRFQERFLIGPVINRINKDFVSLVLKERPDIVIFYRTLLIKPDSILEIKEKHGKCVLVSLNNDNMFGPLSSKTYWRFFKKSIPLYDVNFVYRESCKINYQIMGARNVFVQYSHYLPWLHKPRANLEKPIDIGFYGHFESDERLELLSNLMTKLKAVYELRGSGWKKVSKNRPWKSLDNTEVQNELYANFISSTKIVLCFFSKLNEDEYTRRVFEIPACGNFLLSQRTELMKTLYEEDEEAVFFDSGDELVDKAAFYLKRDELRERIARAGHARALNSGYDIFSRTRQMVDTIKRLNPY